MEIPDYVRAAAEDILAKAWAEDAMQQLEGRLCSVDGENYLKLLQEAETVAHWVKSLALS